MKFAFCIFKYYPYGGLGRELVRTAKLCQQRGHQVDIFAMQWDTTTPEDLKVTIIPSKGFTNHRRCANFVKNLFTNINPKAYDIIIGFNRMPGLDIYYICDVCYEYCVQRNHGFLYKLGNRYKTYANFERAVFSPNSKTQILYKNEMLKQQYTRYYHTPSERFHLLNPEVDANCRAPQNAKNIRQQIRDKYKLSKQQYLILLIGTNFKLKGVDRALIALASLPPELKQKTSLWIIGQGKKHYFQLQARKLGVSNNVKFLGTIDNVPETLLSADLLLHPAYRDAAAGVLLEAMAAGLPTLTTETCGFAPYITKANAGLIVSSPFKQNDLNAYLQEMLNPKRLAIWQKNALAYCDKHPELFYVEDMVDKIEAIAKT